MLGARDTKARLRRHPRPAGWPGGKMLLKDRANEGARECERLEEKDWGAGGGGGRKTRRR